MERLINVVELALDSAWVWLLDSHTTCNKTSKTHCEDLSGFWGFFVLVWFLQQKHLSSACPPSRRVARLHQTESLKFGAGAPCVFDEVSTYLQVLVTPPQPLLEAGLAVHTGVCSSLIHPLVRPTRKGGLLPLACQIWTGSQLTHVGLGLDLLLCLLLHWEQFTAHLSLGTHCSVRHGLDYLSLNLPIIHSTEGTLDKDLYISY